jgi:acyl-CoA thioesterase I
MNGCRAVRLPARRLVVALIVVMLLGGIVPNTSGAQAGGLYIALGDSVAAGIGSSLPRIRSYPAVVARLSDDVEGGAVIVENLAVPGETAATFRSNGQLQRLRDVVGAAGENGVPVDLVTVTLGGNEMLAVRNAGPVERQASLDAFTIEFPAALADIREAVGPAAQLVVTTYYDLSEGDASIAQSDAWWIAQFNAVIAETAAAHGARVVEVGEVFRGNIRTYTYHPFDVHPTNAGHRAIAQAIWATLERDTDAPVVDVLSPLSVTRATPTIRFSLSDGGPGTSVTVEATGARMIGPFELGNGTHAVLLDFVASGDAHLTIVARDEAGNTTAERVTVSYAATDAQR